MNPRTIPPFPRLFRFSSELGEILPDEVKCGLAGISPSEVDASIVTCGLRAGRLNHAPYIKDNFHQSEPHRSAQVISTTADSLPKARRILVSNA